MLYRQRATPLHATRAAVGTLWCVALMFAVLLATSPIVLLAGIAAGLVAGRLAGAGRQVLLVAAFMVPWAIAFALINAVVARQGLTVVFRLGDLGPFGQGDVTLEALAYGALFGLRLVALVIPSALFAVAVNPDELLRLAGRVSLRSALGATMATRLVPTLAADAKRLDEARRCRAVTPRGGRAIVVKAVTAGALDRALDVAATLEVRGFSTEAARRRRGVRKPWSRQDIAFAASAVAMLAFTIATQVTGFATFETYPQFAGSATEGLVGGAVLTVLALVPFLARRGVVR